MGLIRSNYTIEGIGITIPTAYAKITNLHINADGEAHAMFSIQQSRADIGIKDNLATVSVRTTINKKEPIYSQIYSVAKEEAFVDWEDDIVE